MLCRPIVLPRLAGGICADQSVRILHACYIAAACVSWCVRGLERFAVAPCHDRTPADARNSAMPRRISTTRGREFGSGLRAAIAGAGLSSRAAAELADWDEAKLSDLVNGKG